MASACNRFMRRSSVSSLRSAIRSSLHKSPVGTGTPPSASSSAGFRIPSKPAASPRFSFSRCPSELGCVQSLLPLHSTVAAARLTSCLSLTSRSSRALSQEMGLSVPR
ncbi:protein NONRESPONDING TO OXYLIPINS 2, mitochondrial isoform X1 [Raphanus sativus]|uniref:Protein NONRESPONDING TO OXYLIPINS 2, mitochondrial isoform X1 n=1 Tax=Raphanus sativus TaxID=3726 RepID=A0A6J0NF97_RAPSA|nr:protein NONRESPONDING TO OXYLIPINS 2, mitochondrial isoform X1 [Raphanus sativus]